MSNKEKFSLLIVAMLVLILPACTQTSAILTMPPGNVEDHPLSITTVPLQTPAVQEFKTKTIVPAFQPYAITTRQPETTTPPTSQILTSENSPQITATRVWAIAESCQEQGEEVNQYLDSLFRLYDGWYVDIKIAEGLGSIEKSLIEKKKADASQRLEDLQMLRHPNCATQLHDYSQQSFSSLKEVWELLQDGDEENARVKIFESVDAFALSAVEIGYEQEQ